MVLAKVLETAKRKAPMRRPSDPVADGDSKFWRGDGHMASGGVADGGRALTEVAAARGGDDGDRSDGRSHGFARGLADPHLA